jgi:hypothetical protein
MSRKWGARGDELYLRATKVTAVKVILVCVCCCCKCCFGQLFAAGAIGVVIAFLRGVRRAVARWLLLCFVALHMHDARTRT